tara:strand:- start:283 stop:978 length:696 start_codon:yes stop_codon:yes gene_type:complete
MKNLPLTTFAIIMTILFSSCSQEENIFLEEASTDLFGKVTLSRDASGGYSMDLETNNDIASSINIDKKNVLDVDIYSSLGEKKQNTFEDLYIGEEDRFSVKLNNTITNNSTRLTVYDKEIVFTKNENQDDNYLTSYSITDNGNNTYDLEFSVDTNIEVSFIQNEDTDEYEIHLEQGNGTQYNFSRTFTRATDEELKIVFVNYSDESGRNTTSDNSDNRKPVIVVDNGEDNV